MAYFLGVDAGGTKTEFLLGDEGSELGRVQTGSIKRLRREEAATEQNLTYALGELAAQTGVSMLSVARCCVGASGSTAPLVSEWITTAFRPRVGGDLLLVEDVDIALDAVFRGGRGRPGPGRNRLECRRPGRRRQNCDRRRLGPGTLRRGFGLSTSAWMRSAGVFAPLMSGGTRCCWRRSRVLGPEFPRGAG